MCLKSQIQFRITLICLSAFLLTGCASLGPKFSAVEEIKEDKGLIYIYRPNSFCGAGVSYDVKVGEEPITTLYNGGYFPYFSNTGEVEFWAKTESKSAVTLDVNKGETYYIKGTVGVGFFVGRPHLIVVEPNIAEEEISKCKLIPPLEKK